MAKSAAKPMARPPKQPASRRLIDRLARCWSSHLGQLALEVNPNRFEINTVS
jgi:hypothetical protein